MIIFVRYQFNENHLPGDVVNRIFIRHVTANETKMHALQNFMCALLIFMVTYLIDIVDAEHIMEFFFFIKKIQF